MNKILAITLGGSEVPSANYRLRQYYPDFQKCGWAVKEFNLKTLKKYNFPNRFKSHAILNLLGYSKIYQKRKLQLLKNTILCGDLIWINKLLPEEVLPLLNLKRAKVVLDVDDAIWINNEELFLQNLQLADAVLCGNKYIEEQVRNRREVQTFLVPTSIAIPQNIPTHIDKKFIIGWLGSSFTNEYLLQVQKPINDFLAAHPDAELHIVSADMQLLKNTFQRQTKFIQWTEENAQLLLSEMSVGIMPMPNEEWVKGKCSFKMIQYMSYGKPVVVSPFGMNADILQDCNAGYGAKTHDEWFNTLAHLYSNNEVRYNFGRQGHAYAKEHFDKEQNFEKINLIFQKLISK